MIAPLKTSKPKKQISIGNQTHTFEEWAKITGIKEGIIKSRYYRGNLRGEKLIEPPKRTPKRQITINGETHTCGEWAKIAGISPVLLYNRVSCGKRGTDIIAPQKRFYKEEIEIKL